MHPLVSVIIPSYNRAEYIEDTVQSVLDQSYKELEIIFVDDGSNDTTEDILKKYVARNQLTYIRQENQGVSIARNRGIDRAQGEYVAFLDDDDIWYPSKLEKQVEIMMKYPEFVMVHTDCSIIDSRGRLLRYSANPHRQSHNGYVFDEFFRSYRCIPLTSSMLVRKDVFRNIGYFDKNLPVAQDYDFCLRLSLAYPIYFLNLPLVKYRITPGSGSRKNKAKRVIECEGLLKRFIAQHSEYFEQHPKLLREKWESFNIEAAFELWNTGNYSSSHTYFKNVCHKNLRIWCYCLISSIPEKVLKLIALLKHRIAERKMAVS